MQVLDFTQTHKHINNIEGGKPMEVLDFTQMHKQHIEGGKPMEALTSHKHINK